MVEAYLDESGTDGRWPVVCVGGYAAPRDVWATFERSWRRQLQASGVDCFHAKERASHPLWGSMLDHIHDYGLRGILCTVPRDAYQEVMGHRAKSTIGNAYAVCAFGCSLKIAASARNEGLGAVSFVIEDGQPNVVFVRRMLESLIEDPAFNVAAVRVAKKQDSMPLQAADLLAHCAGTHHRKWLGVMIGDGPGKALHGHFDDDTLQKTSTQIEEIWRRYRCRERQAAKRTA